MAPCTVLGHAECYGLDGQVLQPVSRNTPARILRDGITVPRLRLPFITVFVFIREQVFHNRSDHAAVGNDAGILPEFRKKLLKLALSSANRFHLEAAHWPHYHR